MCAYGDPMATADRDAADLAFGLLLRSRRRARGWSQLELAHAAGTSPRHLSFVETGRSRPGTDLVERLATALELDATTTCALLTCAGHRPSLTGAVEETPQSVSSLEPVRQVLVDHEPFPGCAIDHLGGVRLANDPYLRLVPDALDRSPEDHVDAFFGESGRRWIENWSEVAWAEADRRVMAAARSHDPEAMQLATRALDHLGGTPRPRQPADSPFVCVRLRTGRGSQRLALNTTVMCFEVVSDAITTGLRLELSYPADDATLAWFSHTPNRGRPILPIPSERTG